MGEVGSTPLRRECSGCGAALLADAPGGLCVGCLLRFGLEEADEEVFDDSKAPIMPLMALSADGAELADQFEHYRVCRQLGEGGCGRVYLAEQLQPVRRQVALKVIKLGMDTRQVVERFEAERQLLALMDHPGIAKVLDAGTTRSGRPFFVMELVDGAKITEFCDQHRLSCRQRLELFIPVCQAVQHAHQKGVIHRDLKPSNVLVSQPQPDKAATPKVIDFGIAKATGQQQLIDRTIYTAFEQFLGTPAYMSPEQAELSGVDIDTRSDIYSLGVLLYELLTGQTPFRADTLARKGFAEVCRIIREQEPVAPSAMLASLAAPDLARVATARAVEPSRLAGLVRGDLDWIVLKALEKDRGRRYETANGLAMDLRRHLDNEPVFARPPTAIYRLQKMVRRHRLSFAAAGVVAGTLICALILSTVLLHREQRAHDRALSAELEQRRLRVEAEAALLREKSALHAAVSERDRAESAGRQSRTVLDFLESRLITAASPQAELGGLGRDVTLREALNAAESPIAGVFTNQPLVEADLRVTLGKTYVALGELAQAIRQFDRALELRRRQLEPDHPDTIAVLEASASALQDLAQYPESLQRWREAVEAANRRFGPQAPRTIQIRSTLGVAYRDSNQFDAAIGELEETVALALSALGPQDPHTLDAMNHLAYSYYLAGRLPAAASLLETVLDRRRTVLTRTNSATTRAMIDLARVYQKEGLWAKTLPLLQEALAIRQQAQGSDHYETLVALSALGVAYAEEGRHAEALPVLEKALALNQAKLGSPHPETLSARLDLCRLLADWAWAEVDSRRAVTAGQTKVGKARDQGVPSSQAEAASAARARRAEALSRKCVEEGVGLYGPGDASPARLRSVLASALIAVAAADSSLAAAQRDSKLAEAERLLLGVQAEIEKGRVRPMHQRNNVKYLVRLYQAKEIIAPGKGALSQAVAWQKKLFELDTTSPPLELAPGGTRSP